MATGPPPTPHRPVRVCTRVRALFATRDAKLTRQLIQSLHPALQGAVQGCLSGGEGSASVPLSPAARRQGLARLKPIFLVVIPTSLDCDACLGFGDERLLLEAVERAASVSGWERMVALRIVRDWAHQLRCQHEEGSSSSSMVAGIVPRDKLLAGPLVSYNPAAPDISGIVEIASRLLRSPTSPSVPRALSSPPIADDLPTPGAWPPIELSIWPYIDPGTWSLDAFLPLALAEEISDASLGRPIHALDMALPPERLNLAQGVMCENPSSSPHSEAWTASSAADCRRQPTDELVDHSAAGKARMEETNPRERASSMTPSREAAHAEGPEHAAGKARCGALAPVISDCEPCTHRIDAQAAERTHQGIHDGSEDPAVSALARLNAAAAVCGHTAAIAVVGMGRSGKSSLVRLLLNDRSLHDLSRMNSADVTRARHVTMIDTTANSGLAPNAAQAQVSVSSQDSVDIILPIMTVDLRRRYPERALHNTLNALNLICGDYQNRALLFVSGCDDVDITVSDLLSARHYPAFSSFLGHFSSSNIITGSLFARRGAIPGSPGSIEHHARLARAVGDRLSDVLLKVAGMHGSADRQF
eukprot:m.247645 g.247645  ORF g.247645 m.247645 type:complete len:588 (+) comp15444_c0_seq1:164-1927(+)